MATATMSKVKMKFRTNTIALLGDVEFIYDDDDDDDDDFAAEDDAEKEK